MTFEDGAESLTRMPRDFMAAVREQAGKDGPDDPVDRALAAAAIAIAAAMLAWPSGRKLPKMATLALDLGRHIWAGREFWISSP